MSLKDQVKRILESKIHRIAQDCYRKANPNPRSKSCKPYTLSQEAHEMVSMLRRIEDASDTELEQFAHFATTGAVRELCT